jgi:hypothetical protein
MIRRSFFKALSTLAALPVVGKLASTEAVRGGRPTWFFLDEASHWPKRKNWTEPPYLPNGLATQKDILAWMDEYYQMSGELQRAVTFRDA